MVALISGADEVQAPTFLIKHGDSFYLTTSAWKLDADSKHHDSRSLHEAVARADACSKVEAVVVDEQDVTASQHFCASQHFTAVPGRA